MIRRSFFRTIGAAFAGAGAVKALALKQPAAIQPRLSLYREPIDAILAHKGDAAMYWKNWQIRWTGWKPSSSSLVVAGQWVALPVNADGSADDSREMLYVSHPGGFGVFHAGDCFDISGRWTQDSAYGILRGKSGKLDDLLEPYRRAPLRLLLELADARTWVVDHPSLWGLPEGRLNEIWPTLSRRSRFYANPTRVLKEEGIIEEDYISLDDPALKIVERMKEDSLFG